MFVAPRGLGDRSFISTRIAGHVGCAGWIPAVLATIALSASSALAQTPPEPDAAATMRFGPLSLKSSIALSNIGMDTNVFNQLEAPQGDFTLAVTPLTNVWLRMGRTWVTGTTKVDWIYFNKYASQRAANTLYRAGVIRNFNRLALKSNAQWTSSRDRPSADIDVRSQSFGKLFDGEVTFRTYAKTYLGVRGSYQKMRFARDAEYFGINLASELNRDTASQGAFVRHDLTPLTSLSMEISRDRDIFEIARGRNTSSTRLMGSVNLSPLALISGSGAVGYRRIVPVVPDLPRFSGLIAAANLSYSLRGSTRLLTSLDRNVYPAYNPGTPFFVQTMFGESLQQHIFGSFDALVRFETRRVEFLNRIVPGSPSQPNRVERVYILGIGAGYRVGADKRIGFKLDRMTRHTPTAARRFKGMTFGMSVTYER